MYDSLRVGGDIFCPFAVGLNLRQKMEIKFISFAGGLNHRQKKYT